MRNHVFFYDFLQSHKLPYISVMFGSIVFKLHDLCQTFWVCLKKLLTIFRTITMEAWIVVTEDHLRALHEDFYISTSACSN